MEERSKRIWLVVVIGVALLACCVLAVVATAGGLVALRNMGFSLDSWERDGGHTESQVERTFAAGRSPSVEVDNFAGEVEVSRGESDKIRVLVTKRVAGRVSDVDVRIEIEQRGDLVVVHTERAPGIRSVSVKIEIQAPAETELDLHTGAGAISVVGTSGAVRAHSNAGSVTIDGVEAEIDASSNAGKVEVRGAKGEVHMQTNAGAVEYEGQPSGRCTFQTNAGSIRLDLPADLDMEVDLSSDAGDVSLEHKLSETNTASRKHIKGTVGDGSQGEIRAHTNAGSVTVRAR